jgi:glycine cleavage system H protein
MLIPEHLHYTPDHLWVEIKGKLAKVGLTDYAQELLGAISYIELPDVSGTLVKQTKLATIEGLKSVIDISSPFTCNVARVNEKLTKEPKLINTSPYDDGWIAELSIDNPQETDLLLTANDYKTRFVQ